MQTVDRNIKAIESIERQAIKARTKSDVLVDAIAAFCGSLIFVYIHVGAFGLWLVWNVVPQLAKMRFDPAPFNLLTLVVSLEAIFLSTFILISQNRQQSLADHRNKLDLQINLLSESETSQVMAMLTEILNKLEPNRVPSPNEALADPTDPVTLAQHLRNAETDPTD